MSNTNGSIRKYLDNKNSGEVRKGAISGAKYTEHVQSAGEWKAVYGHLAASNVDKWANKQHKAVSGRCSWGVPEVQSGGSGRCPVDKFA